VIILLYKCLLCCC